MISTNGMMGECVAVCGARNMEYTTIALLSTY